MVEVVESYGFRLVVRPEIGGSIAKFERSDGTPILHPIDDLEQLGVEGGGSFPLLPFSNRVRDGVFRFDEQDVTLSPNIADTGRVVHGFGWQSGWTVTTRSEASVGLRHRHDGSGGWPWTYEANQDLRLDASGLHISLTLTNRSRNSMPAGIGFHPYFPTDDERRLQVSATGCEGVGTDGFPMAIATETAIRAQLAAGVAPDRNLYLSGVFGDVVLAKGADRVTMSRSSNLDHLVVYRPPDGKSLCIEPTSHRVGALNAPTRLEQALAGIKALAPGDTLACWMKIGFPR